MTAIPPLDPPETLQANRVSLSRASLLHARTVFERWAQDPEVTRFLGWEPHSSVEDTRAFLGHCEAAWNEGTDFVWMLQDRKSGALLGSLSATPSEHRVELGYLMARDFWGRGFMTEAVEVVTSWWLDSGGAHRVWAVCDVENRASARVLEKAGFMLEGTLRKWSRQPNMGDEPRDVLCFSRIRE